MFATEPLMRLSALRALALTLPLACVHADEALDAGLMRMPAVSEKQIAFVYAGDIWIVGKEGGTAMRLSSPRGEESWPRFSPDGREIAFSGNYEGSDDVFVMPVFGGEPRRVTFHGGADRLVGWWPDGKSLVFASRRESFTERVGQFFKIDAQGGQAERLAVPYGEFGSVSPEGNTFAYVMTNTDGASWKRYRGGMAPDIFLFNLRTKAAENLTNSVACESQPMWSGDGKLYFLSDNSPTKRANLWQYDPATKTSRQVTRFTDFDVHYPSIGPKEIVFENAGRLHLLDLATEQTRTVKVEVITDKATLRPRLENVTSRIASGSISPTGKRVLFEARGDIFSAPAEQGIVRNLTESQGVAERYPAWSPDGKWIAYFSDRSGEYELTMRSADGKGEERQLTNLGTGWKYQPYWSPDSKKVVFIDSAMRIWLHDLEKQHTQQVDKQLYYYHGDLQRFSVNWSTDSRWLTYAGDTEAQLQAIIIYDTLEGKRRQVTSAYYDDDLPVFDPNGNYLYYRSKRIFQPHYSDFDNTWAYVNSHALVCLPLRRDIPSPLAPKNDEEPYKREEAKKEEKPAPQPTSREPGPKPEDSKKGGGAEVALRKDEAKSVDSGTPKNESEAKVASSPKPREVRIDFDGIEGRGIVLPVGSGKIDQVGALPGKVIFRWPPRTGSTNRGSPLSVWDLETRAERVLTDDVGGYELSADGRKILYSRGGSWSIANAGEAGSGKNLNVLLEMTVDPRAEWKQMFDDAWRIERDYFYDPHLHMVSWQEMRERYGQMLAGCATRNDVNYVLGELLGELNSSHAYRSGGDLEQGAVRSVGYLGCDFELKDGFYRIKRIIDVAPWDLGLRSPLRAPGINIKDGDWLVAVNGRRVDGSQEVYAAFQGLADKTVILSVNDKPNLEGAREIIVQTISSEAPLRHYAWIEANRRRVDEATNGRVGYLYVKSTAVDGQNELYRQWRAQTHKEGLVIDERWNSGGQIPDRFIELLNRPTTNYWGVRDGKDWSTPFVPTPQAKVMLANRWSGSGGDCFPWLFQQKKMGHVIGTRTWGGLIGMTGCPPLIDGGSVTVPTFSIYDLDGKWIIEGHGVDPDIPVMDDPSLLARGIDPQLERAIEEVKGQLDKSPTPRGKRPGYVDRAR
jgi:tricorn protease